MSNDFIEDSACQRDVRDLFENLNLLEEQFQNFFHNGELTLSGIQKNIVCEMMKELMFEKINDENDINDFKKLCLSIRLIGKDDFHDLCNYLDKLTTI